MGDVGRLPVGIIGASGYGGVQLVRLLADHPAVEVGQLMQQRNLAYETSMSQCTTLQMWA